MKERTTARRRCDASRKDGQPCRAWAVRGTEPPRCASHREQGPGRIAGKDPHRPGGFYHRTLTLEEVADLFNQAIDRALDDELAAVRVAIRRVMEQLEHELSPAEYVRLAETIFKGANTIARLLKAKRDISDADADGIARAIGQALNRAGRELEVEI